VTGVSVCCDADYIFHLTRVRLTGLLQTVKKINNPKRTPQTPERLRAVQKRKERLEKRREKEARLQAKKENRNGYPV
jgi:hypothetical protein